MSVERPWLRVSIGVDVSDWPREWVEERRDALAESARRNAFEALGIEDAYDDMPRAGAYLRASVEGAVVAMDVEVSRIDRYLRATGIRR